MLVAHGIYTGDGNDNRNITGVGFDPHLVIIHGDGSGNGCFRTADNVGDDSCSLAAAVANAANKIQSFITDGFQVGTHADVNTDTVTYYYIAFRDNGDSDFAYGTYTGNDVDDRNITGVGFDPELVVIKGDGAKVGVFRSTSHTGDSAFGFFDNVGDSANRIQSFITDGFQLGTSSHTNDTGFTYYWFAFKEVANEFSIGLYAGDGNDNRNITGVGFDPEIVWIKEDGTSFGVFRTGDHVGDSSLQGAGGDTANRIQSFITDGFQVGTSAAVNQNGIDNIYLAWRQVADVGGVTQDPSGILPAMSGTVTRQKSFNRAIGGSI